MNTPDGESPLSNAVLLGSRMTGIGCAMPILVILAILAGQWLDELLHTTPWLTLIFVLVTVVFGLVVMTGSAFQAVRTAQREVMAQKKREPVDRQTENHARWEEN